MTDAAVIYKSEGHLNDELIIEVGLEDLGRSGFDLYYKITNLTKSKELAFIKTGILCFDYTSKKVCSISDKALSSIKALLDI
jgi:acyl-CoA thioesterase FadM